MDIEKIRTTEEIEQEIKEMLETHNKKLSEYKQLDNEFNAFKTHHGWAIGALQRVQLLFMLYNQNKGK